MNSRKHSRLRNRQRARKVAKVVTRLFEYVYEENREAIDGYIEDVMLWGHGQMHIADGKLVRTPVRVTGSADNESGGK